MSKQDPHFTYDANPNLHGSDTSVPFEQSQKLQMRVGPPRFWPNPRVQRSISANARNCM
jgi:hypothetical protein